jgi:8-oxo-dGTP pyrophosphatase MutT (NUDIX family)
VTTARSTSTDREEGEHSAGFILFSEAARGPRQYLLLRHRNGSHWGFPKGRIEPGEHEGETALREVEEETGIDKIEPIEDFRAVNEYHFRRGGTLIRKQVVYFLGRALTDRVVLSREHIAWRWFSLAAAEKALNYEDAREVLRAADQHLDGAPQPERAG